MTNDTTETARHLLWRHGLPEDVLDGALALHAQELAAVQRRAHDGQRPHFHGGLPCKPEYDCGVARLIALIEPDSDAAPAVVPSADRAALRERIADAIRDAACNGDCEATEEECSRRRIQPFVWHHGVLAEVSGPVEVIADAVLAVLPAPADDLATARATNQRLNYEKQRLESELAAYRRAVGQWEINERGTYIPHSSLRTIGLASGKDILGSVRHLRHFERVEQAEAAIEDRRLALSVALGLGTGASWDAIHDRATELAGQPAGADRAALREHLAAAMREHYLSSNRDDADADGNMPCRCGDWREPGPMGSDEDDWDSHLADAVLLAVVPQPTEKDQP